VQSAGGFEAYLPFVFVIVVVPKEAAKRYKLAASFLLDLPVHMNRQQRTKGDTSMATFNSCQFIGRLGKDPDFNVTSAGKPVAKFSLAVDQGKDQPAMWLNVVAWDKLGEIVEKYAAKGMQVFVQGRLQVHPYEDKTGVKRQSLDIIASTVQLLDRGKSAETPYAHAEDSDPFLESDKLPYEETL
jgi:single-strand DNA-binding protein